jgi:hypothetical protein
MATQATLLSSVTDAEIVFVVAVVGNGLTSADSGSATTRGMAAG